MPKLREGLTTAVCEPECGTLGRACDAFSQIATANSFPVLLTGGTGSGKGFLARRIHERGMRAARPFVALNCAALPENLCERELFGHVRGAFTDARDASPGVFEAANGGTLLLDEIGDMPISLQGKLLGVLESGAIRRLGSVTPLAVDVRIIAATNRDLLRLVRQRMFREDLYYRVAVLRHKVPRLATRRKDMAALVKHLLTKHIPAGERRPEIALAARTALLNYEWPGNVRELENVLRYALAHSRAPVLELHHFPPEIARLGRPQRSAVHSDRRSAPADPDEERKALSAALAAENGNRTRTAKRLGISRTALWMKLKIIGVQAVADGTAEGAAGTVPIHARSPKPSAG